MMNRAFVFDMDGVLVHSEPAWVEVEREYLPAFFGEEIFAKMPNLVGAGLEAVFESARSAGATFDRARGAEMYEQIARKVYERSPITPGVEDLARALSAQNFKLGLVSQSPHSWINQVVPRLSFHDSLEAIVSLQDSPRLRRKPAPDGYFEAFKRLGSDPKRSFVLEDANLGIEAGKATGAFVIGFRGCLVEGYEQRGADTYADTMQEVAKIVESKMKI